MTVSRLLALLYTFLSCFSPVFCVDDKFYKILNVERDASAKEIKKGFRKLSLKYHPDKNPGDEEAKKKYIEITEAYEVLGDEEKRQLYDMGGEDRLKQQNEPESPFDIFFGGGNGGGKRKGPDHRVEFSVTLEELYNGAEREFNLKRNVVCKTCRGTGAKGGEMKTCNKCRGRGIVTKLQRLGPGFNVQMQTTCDKCGGRGSTFKESCPVCGGHKVSMEEKTLDAVIERGMPNGQELKFERAGEQVPDQLPGDVILVLKTQKHKRFKRNGNDLHYEMKLSLKEALLGFNKTIKHLDGRDVEVKRSGVTQHGYVMKLPDEGMPHHNFPSDKGILRVSFKVSFPKTLTSEQKQKLGEIL